MMRPAKRTTATIAGLIVLAAMASGAIVVSSLGDGRSAFSQTVAVGNSLGDSAAHCVVLPVASWPATVFIQVANTGSVALTDLAVQGRPTTPGGDANWVSLISGATWSDTSVRMLDYTSDRACRTLAAGSSVTFVVDCPGPGQYRIAAAAATAGEISAKGTIAARQ